MTNPQKKLHSGFVTLLGLPNAGKSSLLNALVGEKIAIVTPKAQTTWTLQRGYVSTESLQLVLTDTPGLQEGTKALNAAMMKNAIQTLNTKNHSQKLTSNAITDEWVALVLDAAELGRKIREHKKNNPTKPFNIDILGLKPILGALEKENIRTPINMPFHVLLNKSDLVRRTEHQHEIESILTPILKEIFKNSCERFFWISTSSKKGLTEWLEVLQKALPLEQEGALFEQDVLSDKSIRAICAEFIREQCFMQLGAEIPYSTAVEITSFKEENNLTRVEVTLHVERESQKAVVLGKRGAKIKSIGTKAREKMEDFLKTKIFLGIKVKVTPHWAREQRWVERFGYGSK